MDTTHFTVCSYSYMTDNISQFISHQTETEKGVYIKTFWYIVYLLHNSEASKSNVELHKVAKKQTKTFNIPVKLP